MLLCFDWGSMNSSVEKEQSEMLPFLQQSVLLYLALRHTISYQVTVLFATLVTEMVIKSLVSFTSAFYPLDDLAVNRVFANHSFLLSVKWIHRPISSF